MKKGHSYSTISDKTHPKHKLVRALINKGYSDFELIYASHLATDAGWTLEKITFYNGFHGWLGYTIKSALICIESNIETKGQELNKGMY